MRITVSLPLGRSATTQLGPRPPSIIVPAFYASAAGCGKHRVASVAPKHTAVHFAFINEIVAEQMVFNVALVRAESCDLFVVESFVANTMRVELVVTISSPGLVRRNNLDGKQMTRVNLVDVCLAERWVVVVDVLVAVLQDDLHGELTITKATTNVVHVHELYPLTIFNRTLISPIELWAKEYFGYANDRNTTV